MRNLPVLNEDPLALYDAIAGAKGEPRRSRLRGLRDRVQCAYLRYYAHAPAVERQRPLKRRIRTGEAGDLRHCYESATAVFQRAYTKIRETSYFCAYCGIWPSATLDHYLPKDGMRGFPELATLPANLVPSCNPCNSPRDFRDENGRRALVHPYFDVVCQDRMLFADMTVSGGVPDVEFRVDLGRCSDKPFGRLYERHVRLLGLLPRYRTHAKAPDTGLLLLTENVRVWAKGRTSAELVALFLADAENNERLMGANHFKTALLYGVAASVPFVEFCLGRTS